MVDVCGLNDCVVPSTTQWGASSEIQHLRGVRQGDSLSPLLFILESDRLTSLPPTYGCSHENRTVHSHPTATHGRPATLRHPNPSSGPLSPRKNKKFPCFSNDGTGSQADFLSSAAAAAVFLAARHLRRRATSRPERGNPGALGASPLLPRSLARRLSRSRAPWGCSPACQPLAWPPAVCLLGLHPLPMRTVEVDPQMR